MIKKSGILVCGESKKEHELNAPFRQFQLGNSRVHERTVYDMLGSEMPFLRMITLV